MQLLNIFNSVFANPTFLVSFLFVLIQNLEPTIRYFLEECIHSDIIFNISNMNHLNPIINRRINFLNNRESPTSKEFCQTRPPIRSHQINYFNPPVKFTYFASHQTSQNIHFQDGFTQIHNRRLIQSQSRASNEIRHKRNKIFGNQQIISNFTPRRRISVQSRQQRPSESNITELEHQNKKYVGSKNQQSSRASRAKLQQIQKQKRQKSYQSSEDQIRDSLARITHKPVLMEENKSKKSQIPSLEKYFNQDLDIDDMMSVQLNNKKDFDYEPGLSPIAPVYINPILLQQPILNKEKLTDPPVFIKTESQKKPLFYFEKSWNKILLGIVLSYFIFQIIK